MQRHANYPPPSGPFHTNKKSVADKFVGHTLRFWGGSERLLDDLP